LIGGAEWSSPGRAANGLSASTIVAWTKRPTWWPQWGRRLVANRAGSGIPHTPAAETNRRYSSGQPVSNSPDDELAQRANHEKQTEGIADEPGHANQHSGHEDDQAVEQLPGGHLSSSQPLLGVGKHAETNAPDDQGPQRAHDNQDSQRPEKTDLPGHEHKRGDLCANEQQKTEEEHEPRVIPEICEIVTENAKERALAVRQSTLARPKGIPGDSRSPKPAGPYATRSERRIIRAVRPVPARPISTATGLAVRGR